MTSHLR